MQQRLILPDNLRINGLDYAVDMVESLADGVQVCYGKIWPGKTKIEINIGAQSSERMLVTLWHEVVHAILIHAGVDLGDDEERIVEALGLGIYQVLADNLDELVLAED